MSVQEHYLHLQDGLRRQAADHLLTRDTSIRVAAGPVLLGMDADAGRHVLVPLGADDNVVEDDSSAGVLVRGRPLVHDGNEQLYLDVECTRPELGHVFETLAQDLLGALSGNSGGIVAMVHSTLEQWRALLRTAVSSFGRQAAVGLIGELVVLEMLARHDVVAASASWRGDVHDFAVEDASLEVKATASVDGSSVTLHNLDQLDPGSQRLLLALVHLRPAHDAPSIDDRVRELERFGVPRAVLAPRLHDHGYVHEAVRHGGHRYEVRSIRVWEVHDDSPGLRRSAIRPEALAGVSRITHELAVDVLGTPWSDDEVPSILATWLDRG